MVNRSPYSTSPPPSSSSTPTPTSSTSTSDDSITSSTLDSSAPNSESPAPASSISESSTSDSTPASSTSDSPVSDSPTPDSPNPPKGAFKWRDYLIRARQNFSTQKPTVIEDTLSPTPSHLLHIALADRLRPLFPSKFKTKYPSEREMIDNDPKLLLPQGHHLVYFPLQLPPSQLMADGTDPAHCPGAPFTRRMWAGGELKFLPKWDDKMRLDGRRGVCMEKVVGPPVMKYENDEGREKVFVDVKRTYFANGEDPAVAMFAEDDLAAVQEVRQLVFMREPESTPEGGLKEAEVGRVVKAQKAPEWSWSFTPDATLLFHFSALTYNAHAIHLDPDYARNREGYKERLVHGPLTLVLMLQAVRACMGKWSTTIKALKEGHEMPYIKSLTYRNLAPLYVNEEMKICLRKPKGEEFGFGWDVWIEGPDGGLAVKGHAVTTGFQKNAINFRTVREKKRVVSGKRR